MSDDATPRLGLPYMAAGQAQKHLTYNEALSLLDGLVQTVALSRTVADQPADPADGALYILPEDATGDRWASLLPGDLVRFEAGGWSRIPVGDGHLAVVLDESALLVFYEGGWEQVVANPDLQNLPLLGVGATADAANPLTVKAGGVLLTAKPASDGGTGDLRLTINKEAAGDTGSLLFQSGYAGRAEFGLAGDDDFRLKVSDDGATWREALAVDRATGKATFARSPLRPSEVSVFTASGSYAVPAWARRLTLVCIGGGGGGGSGAAGTNAANRSGGGGGGAGGRSRDEIDVAELSGSTLTVVVGAAGTGGAGVTGTANGAAGAAGGDSSIADGAQVLIAAGGGLGGGAGTTANAAGGLGGIGLVPGNAGGAGSIAASPVAGADGSCGDGPGAGGGAGGLNTGGATTGGKEGGHGFLIGQASGRRAARGAGGVSGAAGSAGADKAWQRGCGAGGGGGGGLASANGGAGGAGGAPGGAGGGGGATRDTHTSGGGGNGARGEVWIIAIG